MFRFSNFNKPSELSLYITFMFVCLSPSLLVYRKILFTMMGCHSWASCPSYLDVQFYIYMIKWYEFYLTVAICSHCNWNLYVLFIFGDEKMIKWCQFYSTVAICSHLNWNFCVLFFCGVEKRFGFRYGYWSEMHRRMIKVHLLKDLGYSHIYSNYIEMGCCYFSDLCLDMELGFWISKFKFEGFFLLYLIMSALKNLLWDKTV